jgi:curved DNA-binding protein CbpA
MDINRKLLGILLDPQYGNQTGILRIEKGTAKKQLILRSGLLAFAESNAPQEHLARIMVAMDLLPRTKLGEVASSMKNGMTSEEAILAIANFSAQDLEKVRREQATIIMASILVWNDCEIRFFPGDGLVRHQVNLYLKLSELIMIAVRHAISKQAFRISHQFLNGSFSLVEGFAEKMHGFPLNSSERYACSLLANRMTASELLPLIPTEKEKPEEVLLCLYLLGFVSLYKEQVPQDGETLASNSAEQELEEMQARFKSASLYEVLSVSPEANAEEIQTAYHNMAKQLHPDHFQSAEFSAEVRVKAEQIFARINEAYLTLRSPGSRAAYDTERLDTNKQTSTEKSGTIPTEVAAEGLFLDGKASLAKGDFEVAVERLKGCVWLCARNAAYQYYLGIAESKIPRLRKSAEQHLLRAIELGDVSAESHLELAKLYIDVKLPRKAELELQRVMNLDPYNSEGRRLSAELKKFK